MSDSFAFEKNVFNDHKRVNNLAMHKLWLVFNFVILQQYNVLHTV